MAGSLRRRKHPEPGFGLRYKKLLVGTYNKTQKLFFSDESRLARIILDGVVEGLCPVGVKEVEKYFRNKWESTDGFKGFRQFSADQFCANEMLANRFSA